MPEVEVEDRDAARTVLRHCAGEARKLGITEMRFPLGPSHPFARLCLELGAPLLPHWQLTQLLAGYRAVGELDPPLPGGDAEALKTVLPKAWPYSSPDPDHGEDVLPPDPYAPAARAEVEKTVLPWYPK